MIENRIARRTEVRLDAIVATVVASGAGTVTDLSQTGAKVLYEGASVGDRISLVAMGQDVCGTVAWADPDRFGMKFDQPLTSGPLAGHLQRIVALRPRVMAATGQRVFGRRAA